MSDSPNINRIHESQSPSVLEVFLTFIKLGLTSYGGPIAHLGYFRKELVARRQWVNDNTYGQLLAVCQFLPGPASSQLGFALGYLRAGWGGSFAAFIGFTLPSAILLLLFAQMVLAFGAAENGVLFPAVIHGLKLVACAIVADAVIGMSRNLCPDTQRRSIAVIAAAILLATGSAWMQLVVIAISAVAGVILRLRQTQQHVQVVQLTYGRIVGFVLLTVFSVLLLIFTILPATHPLVELAQSFYRAGALVFGGGHVVLSLLQESMVDSGLVSSDQFLSGYGASQAIPGPMFAFSAYLGALVPTGFHAGVGAFISLIFMFAPGFLLLAAVLPFWKVVSGNDFAQRAIAGVNAAVVGLLAAALYDPLLTSGIKSSVDMAIVVVAFGLLTVLRMSALWVVFWCVLASVLHAVMLYA